MLHPKRPGFIHAVRALRIDEWRLMARAWIMAPIVRLSLGTLGFESTLASLELLAGHAPRFRAGDLGTMPSVVEGERLVRLAFRAHPLLRGRCLERALVQYGLHRLDRTPARFVIGVSRGRHGSRPHIDAHAWVEAPGTEPTESAVFSPLFARGG